jgi:DNA-binding response OmpR family regulator
MVDRILHHDHGREHGHGHEEAAAPRQVFRVLVVEDPSETGGELGASLAREGFAVRVCPDGLGGLHAFIRELPDLIVTSDRLTGLDGFELVRRVREISDVPVVVVASEPELANCERAMRLGVDRFLPRSLDQHELALVARELVEPARRPHSSRKRLTAAHVRSVARSELRAELERLLVECRGNLAEIGRRMGKDRSTIRYHLRRFGMLVDEGSIWLDH